MNGTAAIFAVIALMLGAIEARSHWRKFKSRRLMMTNKVTFHEFMRAGHIQRWHVVNTVKQQSVAEHCYMVTVIAMELFQKVVGFDDPAEVSQLMAGAMFHDAPEIRYGDIPTPGKNFIRNRAGEHFFDDMDNELMPEVPYVGGKLPARLVPFIKLADAIEAVNWITANKAGPQADIVARSCNAHLNALVAKYTTVECDFYGPVNDVLMALGLPYIYREAKEQPL
jgi:5'-deoxynucleotidase YfbR-like HD superfamily hydrolase